MLTPVSYTHLDVYKRQPLGNLINTEEELAKLEADLKYQEGFLQSVLKKLSNEKLPSHSLRSSRSFK